jgi:hypothetical protein
MSAMSTTPMAQAAAGVPSLSTTEEKFDDTADDLRTFIRERLLADANLESKTADEAVYLLKGDPTCRSLPRAGDPAPPTLDNKCVEQLAKLEVRIVMRADGDGVRLKFELGPDKLELVTFVVHSNLIAVEVDFAKAYVATKYAQEKLGTDSPMGGTQFEKLAGAIRVSLQKDDDKQVTFAASVLSAIDVAEKSAAGVPGPEVKLAPSDPLVSVSLDGVAKTADVKLGMAALDVAGTWDPQNTGASNRDAALSIAGLTGDLTFKEGTDELVAKGLGVGATSFKVRGASIFDLGLNPADQHRFDLKITVDAAGEPHYDVTPRFDLSIGTHFQSVAADYAADHQPPTYVLDETYRVDLENGGATSSLEVVPSNGTFSGGIKIDAGTLTLSTTAPNVPAVTVGPGQCLTGVSMVPAGAHPILGAFASVACP